MKYFQIQCRTFLAAVLCLTLPALSFGNVVNTASASYKDQAGVTTFTATSNTVTIGVLPTVSTATVTGVVGSTMTYQIVATQAPTSYSIVSGTLPAGLTLATATGVISGTPTAAGTTNVVVGATNAAGRNTATLTFTITAPAAPNITLTKSASATTARSGDTVTFTITYTNATGAGVGTASNLVITDPVPAGSTVGTINNGGVNTGGTITWTIPGTVAPGGTGSVSFQVTVN